MRVHRRPVHRLVACAARPSGVAATVTKARLMPHQHLVGTECVPVLAAGRWMRNPLAGGCLHQFTQHNSERTTVTLCARVLRMCGHERGAAERNASQSAFRNFGTVDAVSRPARPLLYRRSLRSPNRTRKPGRLPHPRPGGSPSTRACDRPRRVAAAERRAPFHMADAGRQAHVTARAPIVAAATPTAIRAPITSHDGHPKWAPRNEPDSWNPSHPQLSAATRTNAINALFGTRRNPRRGGSLNADTRQSV